MPNSASAPFVSIIMPVRNEADFINQSLDAVFQQDWPSAQMEVIVADGMSTDKTRDLVQALMQQHTNLKLVDNPGKIAPTGLNAARRHAQGDIIVRVDGHCEIAPDYVRRCVDHLRAQPEIDCVGGPIETVGGSSISQVIALGMSSVFGVGGSAFRTVTDKTMLVDTVAFPAYRKSIMQKAGWFDEELVRNQDDEYSYRLRKLGAKILLASDVHVRYYSRSSLSSLWRQYYQYGFWKVRVLQKHPRQMSLRQFAPPLFVAALLLSLLLALFMPLGWWLLSCIGGSYLLANLAATLVTAAKTRWRYLLLLPVVFAILHVSYGLGFLVGLVKFVARWTDNQSQYQTARS